MDLDIEMADAVDVADTGEAAQIPEAYTHDIITGEEQEPGEVDDDDDDANGRADNAHEPATEMVLHKIHIRGLDTFNPDEVKAYVSAHFSGGQFDKIEWVDDTSANLVYKSESTAQEALVALSSVEIADATLLAPLQGLPAKSYAPKPDSVLEVRFAVTTDKKVVGASTRSRFYLLNPEYDPEERKRRGDFQRNRYRDRDSDYHRDRRGDRRDGRRREYRYDDEDSAPFDVNLYDDVPDSLAKRATRAPRSRRSSASSGSDEPGRRRSFAKQNQGKELFPSRRARGDDYSRGRSMSPSRDSFAAQEDIDGRAREDAALRNREKARSMKERMIKDNSTKELFPSRDNSIKELFPSKGSASVGSKAQMDRFREDKTTITSARLADRITPRDGVRDGNDFSIRGLATKRASDQGIAIKGTGASVKELFPERFANSGKELFADKLEGRGRTRQRAADSFY
ncbi:hypothetical protein GQ53DRAFT_440169 [Thozetella sp. PMI_491]|nr:hypothetical protein GQ53DRAFT_440169 [Thozetella sp. PMI_491]